MVLRVYRVAVGTLGPTLATSGTTGALPKGVLRAIEFDNSVNPGGMQVNAVVLGLGNLIVSRFAFETPVAVGRRGLQIRCDLPLTTTDMELVWAVSNQSAVANLQGVAVRILVDDDPNAPIGGTGYLVW